jgi:tetratricopeptide (TPR) repeat protein
MRYHSARLLLALPLLMAVTGRAQEPKSAADGQLQAALNDFYHEGNRQHLGAACHQALERSGAAIEPKYYLGVLAEADENWTEAERWFAEVAENDGTSIYGVRAKRELGKVVSLKKNDVTPEGKLRRKYEEAIASARLLERHGFPSEALTAAAQAEILDPSRWEAPAVAGAILLEQKQIDLAEQFLQRAQKLASAKDQPTIERALQQVPREREYLGHAKAAATALQARDYGKAAKEYSAAWSLFPARPQYALASATAYIMAGGYADARPILERVATMPDKAAALKAHALLQSTKAEQARVPNTGTVGKNQ